MNYFYSSKLFTNQYGFRPHHSTQLATLDLFDNLIYEADKNNTPLTIFHDISEAFYYVITQHSVENIFTS